MKVLITGGKGYVATNLYKLLSYQYDITLINRDNFDLTNLEETKQWFDNKFFDVVIHTAIKGGSRLEQDPSNILDDNLIMYYNLLKYRDHYKKFINLGSGAEIYNPKSFYGMSKRIISSSILDKNNFYTLRIYGLFNEYELSRRFIKANMIRYIQHENIIIHQNKHMDFIYFNDFAKIVKIYIENDHLPKDIDCVYHNKYSLLDIANIINTLDNHTVNIEILDTTSDTHYIGNSSLDKLNIETIGLEQGIINSYREIKNEKNMVCSE